MKARARVAAAAVACVALGFTAHAIREGKPAGQTGAKSAPAAPGTGPAIPEFWSTALLEDYELPLATPSRMPSHVPRDYYYALPERRVYKSYPVYHPDR